MTERFPPAWPVAVTRAAAPYAASVLLTAVALVIGRPLERLAHPSAFFVFFASVGFCAWQFRLGPGLLAAVLSGGAVTWLVPGPAEVEHGGVLAPASRFVMFGAIALGVGVLRSWRDAARQRETDLARSVERAAADRETAVALASHREETLALLDALLASSPVGFAYVDCDLRYVLVNRVLAETNGLSPEAHVGRRVRDVVPDLSRFLEPALQRVIAERKPVVGFEVEAEWPPRSRRTRSWLVSAYPVIPRGSGVVGAGAVVVEITERKYLEAQLRQAQKMEAIGRLAGGVAHDFNNILTAIKSYSQLLSDAFSSDDPRAHDAREIEGAAERAAALTRQLLAFSRQQLVQPAVLPLDEVVAGMERLLARLIGEDVEFVTRLGANVAVRADLGQLEQVLLNLAVNARDAMPDGGVLLIETATVTRTGADDGFDLPPGTYARLSVRDTGVGMDADTIAHAFEPFFTTKEHGKGTGLGLSTVYGIVKQSEGDVRVTSTPGQGTVVDILLPSTPLAAGTEPVAPAAAAPRGGDESVLVVEDDEMLRPLMRRILERSGYRVHEASRGRDALGIAAQLDHELKLVITDVVMPEMGGRELAERLLAIRPAMKVLFVSGYTDDVVIRRGIIDRGHAFLRKPFTPDELTAKAREVLDSEPGDS